MRITLTVAALAVALGAAAAPAAEAEPPAALPAAVEPVDYPLPAMLSQAGRARLKAERAVMAHELAANARYDPAAVRRAVQEMDAGALDTVQDNLERFARALAALEPAFARGRELAHAGKPAEAAAALEPLMAESPGLKQTYKHDTMSPCCYEITKFLYAECLGRLGNLSDTIISYQIVFDKLPGSLTFSAAARVRAARIYEATGRAHFAIPLYKALLEQYADLLADEEVLRLSLKVAAMVEADPFRAAARTSAQVAERLRRAEGGAATQAAQTDLIRCLQEMLVIEEQEERPFLENTQTLTFGATTGELKEGTPPKDFSLLPVDDPSMTGGDDWGRLRPRERQQLMQMFKEMYPDRYREMLEEYYKNISEAQSRGDAARP